MFQETVLLCIFLGLFLLFFVCSMVCFMCTFESCLVIGLFFFPCARYIVYQYFRFSGIPLTLIGMPMLNCFTGKPNVDVGNAIFPSIISPVNADDIKDRLKNWHPYPMIIHVIHHMVSSSYTSICSLWPLMTWLNFHSIF